jgi:hypothetical protein
MVEVQNLRHLCDVLAKALVEGGVDRQWEALGLHEQLRGGVAHFPAEAKVQAKRARKPKPSQGIQGFTYRDFNIQPKKDEDQ